VSTGRLVGLGYHEYAPPEAGSTHLLGHRSSEQLLHVPSFDRCVCECLCACGRSADVLSRRFGTCRNTSASRASASRGWFAACSSRAVRRTPCPPPVLCPLPRYGHPTSRGLAWMLTIGTTSERPAVFASGRRWCALASAQRCWFSGSPTHARGAEVPPPDCRAVTAVGPRWR
jgi:hypothetical protein